MSKIFMNHNTGSQMSPRTADRWGLVIIAILFVGPFFLFPSGWFGDDGGILRYAQRNLHSNFSDIFFYKDNVMGRYRPLMQILATFSYRHFGLNSVLISVASYLAFLTTLATLYALLRELNQSRWAPLFTLVWFAVLPIKTQALFRLGRPEIFITAFSLLAIFCLQKSRAAVDGCDKKQHRFAWLTGSVIFAIGAALWSEIGISVFLVMALWIIAPFFIGQQQKVFSIANKPDLHATMRMLLAPIAGITIYLTWYCVIGAPLSGSAAEDRYHIDLGWNIVSNISLAFTGLVSPISTPMIARIVHGSAEIYDWLCALLGLVSLAMLSTLVGISLRRDIKSLKIASVFLGSAILSLVPFIFVGHVSEVYLAQAAAFISCCFGVLTGKAFDKISSFKSWLFMGALITLFTVMLSSSLGAFVLLRYNANVFSTLYTELVTYRRVDGIEHVILVPPCMPLEFSQYYLPYNKILYYQDTNMPKVTWLSDCRAAPDIKAEPKAIYQVDISGHTTAYPLR
ncbi:MAG: hypothetical protein WC373_12805 [Smithella sp.]|jgi:hypothetical protein